ncbi:N-acetyltransferase [Paenibacillus sp. IHBB 10380]|uniref:N-acetyltransferase n=1 Tax=Paenibacillus sp. IHBB 10380 TaxID=1566358 RepID=UPI0005CF9627|nr:N-acetyltransferase [Paenibacillus sp. IHBB 10380]AJS59603.1 hypothetical protein UB51_15265 [Paenibacillus sp. IHBB 10380]
MHISSLNTVTERQWQNQHQSVIDFIKHYGDKRITLDSYRKCSRLSKSTLQHPGESLLIATVRGDRGRSLAGVSFVSGFGDDVCLIVVHPLYRNRHVGTTLLSSQLATLGRLSCHVALDNISSLKMCFNAGLTGHSLMVGPTDKPTLKLKGSYATITSNQEGEPNCQLPS